MRSVEEGGRDKVMKNLVKEGEINTYGRDFSAREIDAVMTRFEEGVTMETGAAVISEV